MDLIDMWMDRLMLLQSQKDDPNHSDVIGLGFLDQQLWVAPDGYSGETQECFYSKDRSGFFTVKHHWDGGNTSANRTYGESVLSENALRVLLAESKRRYLREFDGTEEKAFLEIYGMIEQLLTGWVHNPGSGR